jgi:hypothetical protein
MGAPRYFPFDAGPHRLRVGARTLDPVTWIELGPDADGQLARKREILAHHHDQVVGALDGATEASAELLAVLREHLVATFPERYALASGTGADAGVVDPRDGSAYIDPAETARLHPIDLAARLVPEDLCLHLPGPDGALRLMAASVAFPSGWAMREKLGQPVGAIHAPVPGYASSIEHPVDRVMASLTPERGIWRLNGSLFDDDELFRPCYADRTTPSRIPEDVVLRIERQTLRRLPESGAVVFTIRTLIDPLTSIADDPGACARLAEWLRALPREQRAYKRLEELIPDLLAWLDDRRTGMGSAQDASPACGASDGAASDGAPARIR